MKPRSILGIAVAALAAGTLVHGLFPRQADLRGFDPAGVARLETSMWRDYYERDYIGLFRSLYTINRSEYGFSPWDSIRLSYYAALASKTFQPTRSREEAQRALPALLKYYGIIRRRGGEEFDAREASRLELEWWQMRRENTTPAQYAEPIAEVSAEVYGVRNLGLDQSALLRAEMMHYRDERRGNMLPADWDHIEASLTEAYEYLKSGIQRP
jgi:hypothetical protein